MPRSDYEERKAARIERYEDRAVKANREAASRANSDSIKTLRAMQGEPIKVGHHSEHRHRRLFEKADNDMRKSVEATDKAKHYRSKATAAESNTAISSDDPEALVKLREKLEKLVAKQDELKANNKALRKAKIEPGDPSAVEKMRSAGVSERGIRELISLATHSRYHCEPFFKHPSYELSNNNAKIRATRSRLASLEREFERSETGETVTHEYAACEVVENTECNRVQIVFPGKPDADTRAILKRSGFRWSRSESAWQRLLNANGIGAAKRIAAELSAK